MANTNFDGISVGGVPITGSSTQKDSSGSTYFVDNNSGSDSNDGSSWDKSFKTLAKAITISNIDIARGSDRWARRNTIFYCADTETATLTAFPNKCDVIGCGSYDANKSAGITGHHAPVNTGNYGTRFFNVWFKGKATASPIITLVNSSSGIEFHNCTFDGSVGTVTLGLSSTASPFLKVNGCHFFGPFATGYISLGAGEAAGTLIENNRMGGSSGYGIGINASTTSSYTSVIRNNFIQVNTTGITVDDNSDLFYVVFNRCFNQATLTNAAGWTGGFDVNADLTQANTLSGADITVNAPTIIVA